MFFDKNFYFIKKQPISLLWSALILFLMVYNFKSSEDSFIPFFDKIVHFALFAILTAINFFEQKDKKLKKIVWIMVFAIFTELIQLFLPYRDCNFFDLVANWLGIFISYFFLKTIF